MVEIFKGGLKATEIADRWQNEIAGKNLGAFALFVGVVRSENNITALSFDVYRPILDDWFESRQNEAALKNALIFMAHSEGDVAIAECSFVAAAASTKRRAALETIDWFVEDFKKHAPIWKFDIIGGERIFAADRGVALPHSGILARD